MEPLVLPHDWASTAVGLDGVDELLDLRRRGRLLNLPPHAFGVGVPAFRLEVAVVLAQGVRLRRHATSRWVHGSTPGRGTGCVRSAHGSHARHHAAILSLCGSGAET